MSKIPSISYKRVINDLQRDGWIVVRQITVEEFNKL